MKAMLTGAALLAVAALPVPAPAQSPPGGTPEDFVVVSYADLDLTQAGAARVLDGRLRAAARRLCRDENLAISHYRVRHLCIRHAVSDGWKQVSRPLTVASAADRNVTLSAVQRGT